MRSFAIISALFVAVALVAWFLVGNIWGNRLLKLPSDVVTNVEVNVDTLIFGDVEPEFVDDSFSDTTSLYIFSDSAALGRWRAEVVGRDVELRSLTMLERTERHTTTSVVQRRPDWEVSLLGEVGNNHSWVGVGVQRNFGRFGFGVVAGANPATGAPNIAARGSIVLWQR
ncbi:MAG: hypothetical protein SNH79_02930 [Rikenellaceae bacterium]